VYIFLEGDHGIKVDSLCIYSLKGIMVLKWIPCVYISYRESWYKNRFLVYIFLEWNHGLKVDSLCIYFLNGII